MPTPNQILDAATTISNEAIVAAVLWHLAIAIALVWLGSGWRPTSRTGLIGVALLGVTLDLGLIAGAVGLDLLVSAPHRTHHQEVTHVAPSPVAGPPSLADLAGLGPRSRPVSRG